MTPTFPLLDPDGWHRQYPPYGQSVKKHVHAGEMIRRRALTCVDEHGRRLCAFPPPWLSVDLRRLEELEKMETADQLRSVLGVA